MADKKISQLTALAAASVAPSTDVMAVVDTNATETKKITVKDVVDGALNTQTANGVVYLNGSKEATAGSVVTYDGTTFKVDGAAVFNDSGADVDFRVEGDTDSNLLFVDASTDRVGVGTNAPGSKLDVNGNGNFSGTLQATLPSSVGSIISRNSSTAASELHIRPASGKDGWLSFTEDTVADRWIIGTKNGNGGLFFNTGSPNSNTDRMTLDASGNLGVGTTSPSTLLHLSGSAPILRFTDTSGDAYAQIDCDSPDEGTIRIQADPGNAGNNSIIRFDIDGTERARITSGGSFLVGTTTATAKLTVLDNSATGTLFASFGDIANGTQTLQLYTTNNAGWNAGATGMNVGKNASTSRSINAGGTINASGTDYAEYMEKAGEFVIAKGDVCGIDADGKLTNVYANAVAFVVKSTNPSYVGGDSWGAGYKDDPEGLEEARQKVDRIAFCGQTPVNVLGATPGQYIVPVNDNGAIKGEAVSNPTFEQYQAAVGKVIAIEDDGRARIIVKVA